MVIGMAALPDANMLNQVTIFQSIMVNSDNASCIILFFAEIMNLNCPVGLILLSLN